MPLDHPFGLAAASQGFDPMRRIIAGMRTAAQPGQVHEAYDGTFYGQGDPSDIALAEEERQTQHARAMQRIDQSAMSFVDPRLESENPALAAQLRQSGTRAAASLPMIEDGPLASMLNKARMGARTLPMVRGAQRTENIADANAEASNFQSTPQIAMRNTKRREGILDAQTEAESFLDPLVSKARGQAQTEGLATATNPRVAGLKALVEFLSGQGQNPYSGIQLGDIAQMFGLDMPGAQGANVGAAAGSDAGSMSMAEVAAEAKSAGVSPESYARQLKAAGVVLTP